MGCPFPGPRPFLPSESPLFFGRDFESDALLDRLLLQPVTVVYGPSGCGKTSLLDAGVPSRLRSTVPNCSVLSFRSWVSNFRESLQVAIAGEAQKHHALELVVPASNLGLPHLLHSIAKQTQHSTFLFLDQFEQIFYLKGEKDESDRLLFFDELAGSIHADETATNFIIGIREDKLSLLHTLRDRLPDLFQNMFRLEKLKQPQAIDAILKPLQNRFGPITEFAESLTSQLLRSEVAGKPIVDPLILQIVLRYYWDGIAEQKPIDLTVLVEPALSDFVRRALSSFSVESEIEEMLNLLLSPTGLRRPLPLKDFPQRLEAARNHLTESNIATNVHAEGYLQIVHDLIGDQCNHWVRSREVERERRRQEDSQKMRDSVVSELKSQARQLKELVHGIDQVRLDGIPLALVRESMRAESLGQTAKALRLLRRAVYELHSFDPGGFLCDGVDTLFLAFLRTNFPGIKFTDVRSAFRASWRSVDLSPGEQSSVAGDITVEERRHYWGDELISPTPHTLPGDEDKPFTPTAPPQPEPTPSLILYFQNENSLLEH